MTLKSKENYRNDRYYTANNFLSRSVFIVTYVLINRATYLPWPMGMGKAVFANIDAKNF